MKFYKTVSHTHTCLYNVITSTKESMICQKQLYMLLGLFTRLKCGLISNNCLQNDTKNIVPVQKDVLHKQRNRSERH